MTDRRTVMLGAVTLVTAFLVLFMSGGTRHAIGLVLKPMAEGFDWERSVIGLAVAVFLVVSAVGMFIAGFLADRFPLRVILSGGVAIGAAGIWGLGFVSEPWHVLVLYGVVFGVSAGVASPPPVGVLLTRRFPGRPGIANAIAVGGMGLGQLIIIGLLSLVLAEAGWRQVFIWLGLVNLAFVPLVVWGAGKRAPDEPPTPAARPDVSSFRGAFSRPYFWLLLAVYALCGFHDFFVSTHVVAFALDQGIGELLSGNLLAMMGLAGLLGVLLAGVWGDRSGPVAPTIFCFFLRVVIFAWVMISKDPVVVIIFGLLFGLTFWITAPLTILFVRDAFGTRNLGALSGFVTMVHHICGGIGAWMGANLFDVEGNYDLSFAIMAGSSLLAILLTLGLRIPRTPEPDRRQG